MTAALERAEAAMVALQDGESFTALAQVQSDDTGSALQGGELGWANPEGYVDNFKDVVLNAEIGAIVGPVVTEYGYHIIQVNGREMRELTDSELATRRDMVFQLWLDELKAGATIVRHDDWLNYVSEVPSYDDLLGDILPTE